MVIIAIAHTKKGGGFFSRLIIAILAAILFPVFAKAREKARQTACLSNQRQLATLVVMYAQDHDQALPGGNGWAGAIGADKGLLHCPSQTGNGPDYVYNGGSHLSGTPMTYYKNPSAVVVLGDSISTKVADLSGADNGSGCADLTNGGAAQRNISRYFNFNAHSPKSLIVAYLDGHVSMVRTDVAANVNTLVTEVNNGHGDTEGFITTYQSTTTSTNSNWATVVPPVNSIVAGCWYTSFWKKTFATGFDITAIAGGGADQNRTPAVDTTLIGSGKNWNSRTCQVASNNSTPPTFNITCNFDAGSGGELHVIWGSWTDNSEGGATLTVVDNTNGVTLSSTTYPDLTFNLPYNDAWTKKESVFLIGQTQSLTVTVKYTKSASRAWLQCAWIQPK
jgi:hypothetical protein